MEEGGERAEGMRRMVEAWSTFSGLVSEKINFFWAGQRKNQLFWRRSAKKSTFFGPVSEIINFFWTCQRKNHLFLDRSAKKSPFFGPVSEKITFFGPYARIHKRKQICASRRLGHDILTPESCLLALNADPR